MKKTLVLLFALGLLFSITACVDASSLYLGTLVDGTYYESGQPDQDVSGFVLSGDFLVGENFTIKFDYMAGHDEFDTDIVNGNVMFGYRVVSNDKLDFDVSLGYGISNFYEQSIWEATSILLGLDLTARLSEKFILGVAYYQSISGDVDAAPDYAITGYKLNLEYLFNDSYSIGLGYRDFTNSAAESTNDYGVSATTLGVGFHF